MTALGLGALAFSGCGSHVKDDALGKACDHVNSALPNALTNRREMAAFGASLAQWAARDDEATKSALAPLIESVNAYPTTPDTQPVEGTEQFWDAFKGLSDKCANNGTPMDP